MFLSLNIVCKRNLNIFFIFCTKSTDFAIGIRTPIEYVENPIYYKTNNIYSLALAKDWLCSDDTLILESDLIFEDEVIDLLLDDPRDTLALVDKYESWMDGTCVRIDDEDHIETFVSKDKFRFNEIGGYCGLRTGHRKRVSAL